MEPCKIRAHHPTPRLAHGAGRQGNTFPFRSREKNVLDIPSYRSGVSAQNPSSSVLPDRRFQKDGWLSCLLSLRPQFLHTDPTFRQEHPEYLCQPRRPKLISPVDVLRHWVEWRFQSPHVGRFLDLVRHLFCFPHDALKFPLRSSIEGFPGDRPFRSRPTRFRGGRDRCFESQMGRGSSEFCMGGFLCLATVLFLLLRWYRSA